MSNYFYKGKRKSLRESKVRYVRVTAEGQQGRKVEHPLYRFRETLAQKRRNNLLDYVYSLGRATVWPPLPGTQGAADLHRACYGPWDASPTMEELLAANEAVAA
jgi:hypothetical protein